MGVPTWKIDALRPNRKRIGLRYARLKTLPLLSAGAARLPQLLNGIWERSVVSEPTLFTAWVLDMDANFRPAPREIGAPQRVVRRLARS